jgi:capsular polysaccharide biosynthesis protein
VTSVEIKEYVRIAWRRSWLIFGLPALVLGLTLLRPVPPRAPTYQATMRFSVGIVPETPGDSSYTYDRYYSWLTAEYLADDLTEVVRSQEIAAAVKAEAQRHGLATEFAPGSIEGMTTGGKLHRILSVSMSWHSPDELAVLARALSTVLTEGQTGYFEQFRAAGTPVVIHEIDPPTIAAVGEGMRRRLELPLRLGLALFAGLSVAFFLEYLDDTVRGPRDLKSRGLDLLGAIPRQSSLPWGDRGMR